MSKSIKLLERLLRRPADFTFKELETLLLGLGFVLSKTGKTSGTEARFINHGTKQIIRVHKPHPNPELKSYAVSYVIIELKKGGYIDGR